MTEAATPQTAPNDELNPAEGLHVVSSVPESSAVAEAVFSPKIAMLGDVELRVDVVLGRARCTLQELLSIRPSQTIELDRQRNSPVEILVNSKPFALGEIVVIDETNLGVRVLEILETTFVAPGRSA
ncbi:MAG TPA: FliM/FliN family flagellar motor switch protein [Acidimicrobiales bacterium]|nr:FliM/FliN family flagellar motor switch protein [Acidimicrobiales bacterium]